MSELDDLRAMIVDQVVGLSEIAERFGPAEGTVQSWTRGAVPRGAPPFPTEAKTVGKVRLWCADEVAEWISAYAHGRG